MIKRANYNGKICIAIPETEISYMCKFADGTKKEILEEKLILFNNTPNQTITI